jgi:alpha-mannosidase
MRNKLDGFSRRQFLLAGATTLGVVSVAGLPAFAKQLTTRSSSRTAEFIQASPKNKILHIIGYSHIDAAWLWPWRDGANVVLNTFRSALDCMRENPGFRYCHSSAIHYKWVQRTYPQMFEEIKERVKEGRLEVVGGWPVEPDCNIPSTESFVRHCLYGKDYFQRALGVDVNIGFNPDSFGHAAGLPTILKNAGYRYYVFKRPDETEMKNVPLLFWWESADGSRVLALRILGKYSSNPARLPMVIPNSFAPGFNHGAFFIGVGDHGGGVTKGYIKRILEMQKDPIFPELRWSTLSEFFAEVEKSSAFSDLPVIRTDLQHHARGCYSAHGEGKQHNRRAERSLVQAETIALIGSLNYGQPYPADQYKAAWWKVLFNQFHDVMAGSAIYTDYVDTKDSLGWACETAQESNIAALESIAKRVDLRTVKEGAVFLFNPLPWPRKAFLQYLTDTNPGPFAARAAIPITHLETREGQKVSIQWMPKIDDLAYGMSRLSAWVELPACGYKVLELVHGTPPVPQPHNDSFTVSESGFGISSLKSPDGKELLAAPINLIVISDTSDTWGHGIDKFRKEIGRPTFVSSDVIEDGPVMRVTRQRAKWNNSEIILDITQHRGWDMVELRFVIDWHEHEQILKLEIPMALSSPRVFAKVPGAIIERTPNGDEEPYQDWLAVQGKIKGDDYAIGLLNDSTYSYDCLGGLLRTVLVRSAPFVRNRDELLPRNDDKAWQDQGRQERRFWLVRGKGPFTSMELDRRAEEMQTPAEYVMESAHEGTEPWERSLLEISPSSVAVLAIKRSEQGEGIVLRLQERSGKPTEASVEISTIGVNSKVRMKAWEIKTLLISRTRGKPIEVREVNLLETKSE